MPSCVIALIIFPSSSSFSSVSSSVFSVPSLITIPSSSSFSSVSSSVFSVPSLITIPSLSSFSSASSCSCEFAVPSLITGFLPSSSYSSWSFLFLIVIEVVIATRANSINTSRGFILIPGSLRKKNIRKKTYLRLKGKASRVSVCFSLFISSQKLSLYRTASPVLHLIVNASANGRVWHIHSVSGLWSKTYHREKNNIFSPKKSWDLPSVGYPTTLFPFSDGKL